SLCWLSSVERLDDVPPKTSDIMVAEIPYRKVLDDKEKKKKKAEEKAAAKVPIVNIEAEMVVNKDAGRKGPRKKRRVRVGPQVHPDSEHVSSPTLNHAKPLEALVNEEHVYPPLSVGRMDTLRDQTDEHATPLGLFLLEIWLVTRGVRGMLTLPLPSKGMGTTRVAYLGCKLSSALLITPVPFYVHFVCSRPGWPASGSGNYPVPWSKTLHMFFVG
ncbi:hypothetical protein Tco_0235090, partial [Tanacetum coccineum]